MSGWQVKITFIDGEIGWFDLGADEETARELFREIRKAHERGKNNPSVVGKTLWLGASGYERTHVFHFELVPPSTFGHGAGTDATAESSGLQDVQGE